MSNSDSQPNKSSSDNWTVEHDKEKCALCVVCARNCPTEALRRDIEGDNLALYFNAGLCDGCGGNSQCEENCPEEAIKCVKGDPKPEKTEYVLLNQSQMVQCEYCDEYFAPTRRIDVIAKRKGDKGHAVDRQYCPLCRRTNLVVDYIEKFRAPGYKAEYRSARDILRKAQKRIDEEKQGS